MNAADAIVLIEVLAAELQREFDDKEEFDLGWFLAWTRAGDAAEYSRRDLTTLFYDGIPGTSELPQWAAEELVDEAENCREEDQSVEDYIRDRLLFYFGYSKHPLDKRY